MAIEHSKYAYGLNLTNENLNLKTDVKYFSFKENIVLVKLQFILIVTLHKLLR